MKNRGFSLIEIVVAVAIMGILSGIVGLQLRSYIAKSKDTRAVATLNTLRVAAQLYQLENEKPLIEDTTKYDAPTEIKKALEKLEPYLDNNAKAIIEKPEMAIGGSRASKTGDVIYGGKVRITFKDPNGNSSDGYYMWLEPISPTEACDIKGNKWIEF
ncbi:type II secretion system protein [Fusobacterium polymorphum]|uniref:type II secretion system protein n=1 Tax=Fusobacterium nucleatum subsp. polymorphum TaxID=76857 RepID=UPI003009EE47